MLLQISRSAFYPKKKVIKNDDDSNSKVGRPFPGFSYGINNCIVDDSVIETLYMKHVEKLHSMVIKKSLKFSDEIMGYI
ncbi:Uncharacterised protein [Clostridium putrefaciens]|uniref:Uncharacterized protein n=1 Tax=Clostridium putrefaciens TaxID=99675 RepID=A0A381J4C7_9CLOT|nr:Uncharacterised protein [Clostridium putrefaciens]